MGRYATLNADTRDIVNCLLPGIAASFGVVNVVDVIPQDIRMRAWDCDRRKHIIGETEDDPRNWGVQFLKDLVTISRLNNGSLPEFHEKLRTKVNKHEDEHPWTRLADIKEIREDYEAPQRPAGEDIDTRGETSSYESSSADSYYEELVEPVVDKKSGRRPRNHEVYEARPQKQPKKRKHGSTSQRLRRDPSVGWERQDRHKRRRQEYYSEHRQTPTGRGVSVINSEREDSIGLSVPAFLTPSITASPSAYSRRGQSHSYLPHSNDNENYEELSIQELQLQIEVAEAELRTSKLRLHLLAEKKRRARDSVEFEGPGTVEETREVD